MTRMTNTAPSRRRAVDLGDSPAAIAATPSMKTLARATYLANLAKNEATRDEKKARKSLFTEMKDAGLREFDMTTQSESGKRVSLHVEIGTGRPAYVVDVDKLRKLVTDEVFMQCVSATQTSVTQFAGKVITEQVTTEVEGTENVQVSEAKGNK